VSWANSTAGKAWKAKGRDKLEANTLLDGTRMPGGPPKEGAKGNGQNQRPNENKDSLFKRGGNKETGRKGSGTPIPSPISQYLFAVMSSQADGPGCDCTILHPTKSLTRDLYVFLDSMSRETLISESWVTHLAIQGLVVKAPKKLLEEKVTFELPNDVVVRPVDRVEVILYLNSLKKSVIIHPFVIESMTQWLILGGVDMVKHGLLKELNLKLAALYGTGVEPFKDDDSTPVQHQMPLNQTASAKQGVLQLTDTERNQNKSTVRGALQDAVSQLDVDLANTLDKDICIPGNPKITKTQKGISTTPRAGHNSGMTCSPTGTSPLGLEPKADQKEGSGSQRNSRFAEQSASNVRVKLPPDVSQSSRIQSGVWERQSSVGKPAPKRLAALVLSPPESNSDHPPVGHVSSFFGTVDEGVDSEEYWRERSDELVFEKPAQSPDSLVDINRANPGEAEAVLQLVREFIDVFAVEVHAQPANVEPFELKVDINQWNKEGKKTGPRPTTLEKQEVIRDMMDQLVKLNCIQRSNVVPYSDIHLVAKPPGSIPPWRPTLDYRVLNAASESMGWPLPRIKDIFSRIGAAKPKYFAIMDMTSGYHQCPISKDSIPLTAFVTFLGVFVWLRLPMGLKSACSYFQSTMQKMFGALVFKCIEIYLDDMLIHGPTFAEFLGSLREVFETARKSNITFNPKKCKFLHPEFKALGLTLTMEGVKMDDSKIKKVLDFPVPVQGKHLKSFIGLANYFREFVPNYATLVAPLHKLIKDYKKVKHKSLDWTPELLTCYQRVQQALTDVQLLYFLDEFSPIYIMTDASDYGFGAYMCQIVNGSEKPIGFLSKSFRDEQTRWKTIEQECFAIYYALTEWECLLQGRKFTVRTDHANLRYMRDSPSEKVNR
jgi:hypothetical protein